jgi:ribose transport system permease protein
MSTALTVSRPHTAIGLGRSIAGRIGFLPALLVALVAGMSAIDAQFYGVINILNILRNASFLAIVACGQALVIIAGGFDLSVGAVVALASVVTAKTMAAASGAFPATMPSSSRAASPPGLVAGVRSDSSTGSAWRSSRSRASW